MKIENKTGQEIRLTFWEIVNEDDVNHLGCLDIAKGETIEEELPDGNIIIETLKK